MSTPATTTDFSAPIYDEPTSNEAGSSSAASHEASAADINVSEIDLNDPALLSGEIDTNADVDAYAAPPPLPDGIYRVKVKQIDVKKANGETARYAAKRDKHGNPYAYTALECRVQDPGGKFDNVPVYDRFLSTMQQRNGGVPIVRVLTVLGIKVPAKTNAVQLMEMLFKALAGEPELEIETVWEGNLDQADRERFENGGTKQPRVLGMHRFPKAKDGSPIPDIESIPRLARSTCMRRLGSTGTFRSVTARARVASRQVGSGDGQQ